jgi:hypothetical protein
MPIRRIMLKYSKPRNIRTLLFNPIIFIRMIDAFI